MFWWKSNTRPSKCTGVPAFPPPFLNFFLPPSSSSPLFYSYRSYCAYCFGPHNQKSFWKTPSVEQITSLLWQKPPLASYVTQTKTACNGFQSPQGSGAQLSSWIYLLIFDLWFLPLHISLFSSLTNLYLHQFSTITVPSAWKDFSLETLTA